MNQPALSPPYDDETLVAYLDGELANDLAAAIDQRLAADAALQQRVDELRGSWRLLDELPMAEVNPQLAQTTIELVALSVMQEQRRWRGGRRALWGILMATGLLLMFGAGSLLAWFNDRRELARLVQDLPMLVRYSELSLIDTPAWLEKLAEIEWLVDAGLPLSSNGSLPPPPERRSGLTPWLAGLDTHQRLELYEHFHAFETAQPTRQAQLRAIAHRARQTQPVDLGLLLRAYAGLVSQVSSTELAQIQAEDDLDARAQRIQQIVYRELAIGYANHLSAEETAGIRDWANELKERNFEYFFGVKDADSEIVRMLDVGSADSIIDGEDIEELTRRISSAGLRLLNHLDEELRARVLRLWVYSCMPSLRPRPQLSSQELHQRFDALPQDRQHELIYLTGDDVIRVLSDAPAATESNRQ